MLTNVLSAPKPIGGGGGGGGGSIDPNIVASSSFNRGTEKDQVSPVTGLTYVEDSLLKPWEKAHRIQNRTWPQKLQENIL